MKVAINGKFLRKTGNPGDDTRFTNTHARSSSSSSGDDTSYWESKGVNVPSPTFSEEYPQGSFSRMPISYNLEAEKNRV